MKAKQCYLPSYRLFRATVHATNVGAWSAYVIDRNVLGHNVGIYRRYQVLIIGPRGRSDWPIRYSAGEYGFAIDHVSSYAWKATHNAFRWIDQQIKNSEDKAFAKVGL